MKPIDTESLLALRQHLSIVHHVPGRIRLRAGPALYKHASTLNNNGLKSMLESLNGIHDIRINPNAASLIIQYDPNHFPPSLWETLVTGSDHKAAQLFDELFVEHERHLTRK
jgi:hypothetical protein